MITRRHLLSSAAVTAPVLALAGCATMMTPPSTGGVTSIIDYIQSAVVLVAKYIPTAEAIASLAASMFPGGLAAVQIGSTLINQLIAVLQSLTPPAAVQARLRMATRKAPIVIGVLNRVQITGYR